MTQTPLQAAEDAFHSIKDTAKDGQFAAIRQVLEDRNRHPGSTRNGARSENGSAIKPPT